MLDVSRSDLVAGVAGAGTIGRGVAQVLAACGARTLLFDAQPGAAEKARASIGQALSKLVEKKKIQESEVQGILGRLEPVASLDAFSACQVVVEAIVEDLAAKRELFSK